MNKYCALAEVYLYCFRHEGGTPTHALTLVGGATQTTRAPPSVMSWQFFSSLVVLLCATALISPQLQARPKSTTMDPAYPLYRQCDPSWATDKMGLANCSVSTCPGASFGRDTVCREGCAMSCISMALATYDYSVSAKPADPGSLNSWLVDNNGYSCVDGNCNNLNLPQVEKVDVYGRIKYIGEIFPPVLTKSYILDALEGGLVVLGHVRNRTHFVLLNGSVDSGNTYTVIDPYYNSTSYSYDEISDVIVYSMAN